METSLRRVTAVLAVLTLTPLVGWAGPAAAEPGEDGAAADPPTWYLDDPGPAWMTERAGDRVQDFAQIGDTVYVGGTFSNVRPNLAGPLTPQAYLAAFDATTGALRATFDPALNGTVFSLAVAPDGSRLYAGGTFTTVNGAPRQRLVALDPATGDTVPGWETDASGGSVRSVVVAGPDLYVGGSFSSIEGSARVRLAKLNRVTGAVDPSWTPAAHNDQVLTIEVPSDRSRVYVAGRFHDVDGAPSSRELVALTPTTGAIVPAFTAQPGREVFDLMADDEGRVWVAEGGPGGRAEVYDGVGTRLARWDTNGDVEVVEEVGDHVVFGGHDFGPAEQQEVASVDPDDLTVFDVTSFEPPTDGGDGVWALHATGTDLWVGGQYSQPSFGFSRYAATTPPPPPVDVVDAGSAWRHHTGPAPATNWRQPGFDDTGWAFGSAELGFGDGDEATLLQPGNITYRFRRVVDLAEGATMTGARLRLLADDGAVVHVNGTEVARLRMPAGPVTDATLAADTAFGPTESTFAAFDVPDGTLVNGPNTVAVEVHQAAQNSSDVSFDLSLRAAPSAGPDTQPPTVPTGLALVGPPSQTTADLTWSPAVDDIGVHHYDVVVDGQPAGSTPTPGFTLVGLAPATTYHARVEAVDAAGNRSGLSPALAVTTAEAQAGPVELVSMTSNWRYLDNGSNQGTAWRQPGFDDSGWSTGPAELGREDNDEATVLAPGPVTYWFRRAFTVGDPTAVSALDLDLLADDGAVVHLNGTEVARENMPAGPVGFQTAATEYKWGAAETVVASFSLPPAALVPGVNVLAVEVHQAPGSTDASFAARLEATGGGAPPVDTTAPTVPTGLALTGAPGPTSVAVGWAASTDDVGVHHYEVTVDGGSGPVTAATSATVGGLAPSSTHALRVIAVDLAGNRSAPSAPLQVTTAPAPPGPVVAIARGAQWRYRDTGVDPGPAWVTQGFNDSSWPVGAAELGIDDGDEATVLTHGAVAYRFRRAFTVSSAAAVGNVRIDLLADDGAVVFVNGVEVVRDNMPAGQITNTTLAPTYRWGSAETTVRTFTVPASMLVDGSNTIAVAVHQAHVDSADVSFDLGLTLVP